ncbi:MAG: hypothetical protein K2X77_12105 [Candidatus Obscuribacterales bacterium]|nr:hypothetical protein [Candidatus Obscuribacterales bacterium]
MIKFEFSLNQKQDTTRYSPDFIENFTDRTFRGKQTFVIDDVDFSYDDVSILQFSRHLRFVWHWTGVGSRPYEMIFATGEMPMRFTRDGADVKVEKFEDTAFEIKVATATVKALELELAIRQYYKAPFKACKAIFPALQEFGDQIDYIPILRCQVVRQLVEGRTYEVRIKDGGMLAELVCVLDLRPGEELDAIFGTTSGCYALLTITEEEARKRKDRRKKQI